MKKKIAKLTEKQRKTFNSLVMLGDSKELALKTVLEIKENNSNLYYQAYCI